MLPIHPGAIDYYEYGQLSFMEAYGDWLWLALFSAGGLSSAMAWMARLFTRQRREIIDRILDRLLCVLTEARAAKTADELNDLEVEVDGLVTHAIRQARRRTTGTRTMSSLIMALDSARVAIEGRRRDLLVRGAVVPEQHKLRALGSRSDTGEG